MPVHKRFSRAGRLAASDPDAIEQKNLSAIKSKLENHVKIQQDISAVQHKLLLDKKLEDLENVDTTELREFLSLGGDDLLVDASQESLDLLTKNMSLTKTFVGVDMISCNSKIVKVTEENNCVKTWRIKCVPNNQYPDVVVKQKFDALDIVNSDKLPTILNLRLGVEGVEVDSDLGEVIKFCEIEKEIQLFNSLVRDYMPICSKREELIRSSLSKHCKLKSDNMVEFVNSEDQVLVVVCINIQLDYSSFCWRMRWMAKLTDTGSAACSSFNIPSSLSKKGTVDDWDVETALDRLSSVARLDKETPLRVKEVPKKHDLSNIDTSTPKVLREKVIRRKMI